MKKNKFRVWGQLINKMAPNSMEIVDWIKLLKEHGDPSTFNAMVDNFIWMQFTGMFDKYGKEIYEGDILKQKHNGHTIIGTMIWNPSLLQFGMSAEVDFEEEDNLKINVSEDKHKPEIIGNIYENPELIKK